MSNPLADIEARLTAYADDLKASVVPVVHDGATLLERFSTSRIVQEVEQLTAPLDPAAEEAIATLIREAGAAAARIAELTAPPAEPPSEPAA